MKQFLKDKYFICFGLIYAASLSLLYFKFHQPPGDLMMIFLFFGIAFPLLGWLLVKNHKPGLPDKPVFKNEIVVITGLILYLCWYTTYGTTFISDLFPRNVIDTGWKTSVITMIKKLLVFVLLPFLLYRIFGFTWNDFGLSVKKQFFHRKYLLVFITISIAVLLFQYFFSHGGKVIRETPFSTSQLITGIPLLFIWLLLEAGLVEEFFFRALLQTRISLLVKSETGGILISGLIFGLAHAPGLYLRGAGSEGVTEQLPLLFWVAYTIVYMSVAGIFLGILYNKTKNLWIVIAIHAMVDLLPGLPEFIYTWHL